MDNQARPVTHYMSSKGPKPIAELPYPYLRNAAEKLRREGDPARAAELAAMDARLAEEEEAAPAPPPIGDNGPPLVKTYAEVKEEIDDLFEEAKNWLDGQPIETQGQADAVSKLLGMLRAAEKAADEARKLENIPFDTGKAAVQAKFAPLIADTKAMRGKTVVAAAACLAALDPWLKKLDEEHQAQVAAAAATAAAAIEVAQVAAATADGARIDDAEEVEDLIQAAKGAQKNFQVLEAGRARVGGGEFRATLLRDNWVPHLEDGDAALAHYWKMRRADVEACLLTLAGQDIRAGKRTIPGFEVRNEKKAA